MANIKKFNLEEFTIELFNKAKEDSSDAMEYYSLDEKKDTFVSFYYENLDEDVILIQEYVLREFPQYIEIFNKYFNNYIDENASIKIVDPVDYFLNRMKESTTDSGYFYSYLKCELDGLIDKYEDKEELLLILLSESRVDDESTLKEEIRRYFL